MRTSTKVKTGQKHHMERDRFIEVKETLYRQRKGILILRDCIVGHIPRYWYSKLGGKKTSQKKMRRVRPWMHLEF